MAKIKATFGLLFLLALVAFYEVTGQKDKLAGLVP
jgi:hypothetical protein